MAVSLAIHAVLVLFLALQLTFDPTEAPKEESSVAVELVEPPKPPVPKPPAPKPPPPPQEEKKPRMPVPKPAPAQPKQPQAFESGAAEPEAEKPDAAASAEARKPASSVQAQAKPAAKPQMTPKAIDALRAKLQAADAEQSGQAAPAPQKAAESKPEAASKDADAKAEAEKQGQDEGKAETGRMKEAKEHFSKRMLSDPRVKAALGQLPPERRIVQICSIEALEQVRHAQPDGFPDLLVPFSAGGGLIENHVLNAKGGAYRSRDGWFDIAYRCEVDAQTTRIVSFRYEIGAAIPRNQWARRKLPAD